MLNYLKNRNLSENFTLEEMIYSETAEKQKMDNTPSLAVIHNLEELCKNLLQPIRDAYGKPIKVTSGYRSSRLNYLVGGSPTSAHRVGWGADIVPVKGTFKEFKEFVMNFLEEHPEIKFDQVIVEKSGRTQWLHLGYKNQAGKQRMQNLVIEK